MFSFYIMMRYKKNISSYVVYIYLVDIHRLNILIIICYICDLNLGTTLKIARHLIEKIPN